MPIWYVWLLDSASARWLLLQLQLSNAEFITQERLLLIIVEPIRLGLKPVSALLQF
jgi:hypothetical protein